MVSLKEIEKDYYLMKVIEKARRMMMVTKKGNEKNLGISLDFLKDSEKVKQS